MDELIILSTLAVLTAAMILVQWWWMKHDYGPEPPPPRLWPPWQDGDTTLQTWRGRKGRK